MEIARHFILIVGFVITALWTHGCREKYFYATNLAQPTVAITAIWWILLILAFLRLLDPLHLLWAFPIAILTIPLIYFSCFGLPLHLLRGLFLFVITTIPTKNDTVRQISMKITDGITKSAQEIYIEGTEDEEKQYRGSIFVREVIMRYSGLQGSEADKIILTTRQYFGESTNEGALWPVCYHLIAGELKKRKIEITKSKEKTIKKTIISMTESWAEQMNFIMGND